MSYRNAYLKLYTTKYEKYTKWHGALTTGMHIYAALKIIKIFPRKVLNLINKK